MAEGGERQQFLTISRGWLLLAFFYGIAGLWVGSIGSIVLALTASWMAAALLFAFAFVPCALMMMMAAELLMVLATQGKAPGTAQDAKTGHGGANTL